MYFKLVLTLGDIAHFIKFSDHLLIDRFDRDLDCYGLRHGLTYGVEQLDVLHPEEEVVTIISLSIDAFDKSYL